LTQAGEGKRPTITGKQSGVILNSVL